MVAALTLSGSETRRRGVSAGDPTPVGVPQRYLRHHHLILTTVFTDAGIRRVFRWVRRCRHRTVRCVLCHVTQCRACSAVCLVARLH